MEKPTEITDTLQVPGPVLGLDRDGVCSPFTGLGGGSSFKFSENAPQPGFIDVFSGNMLMSHHPCLGEWLQTLHECFTTCFWTSHASLEDCHDLARQAGAEGPTTWPHMEKVPWVQPDKPVFKEDRGWGPRPLKRMQIDENVSVALVDDLLGKYTCSITGERWYADHYAADLEKFLTRPGPTLIIAPDLNIGLTQSIIERLCRFAADPTRPEFLPGADRTPHQEHQNRWIQWPWPLGEHRDPINVQPENEQDWQKDTDCKRMAKKIYRYRKWKEKAYWYEPEIDRLLYVRDPCTVPASLHTFCQNASPDLAAYLPKPASRWPHEPRPDPWPEQCRACVLYVHNFFEEHGIQGSDEDKAETAAQITCQADGDVRQVHRLLQTLAEQLVDSAIDRNLERLARWARQTEAHPEPGTLPKPG